MLTVDKGWAKLVKEIKSLDKLNAKVGLLSDGKAAVPHGKLTNIGLAVIHTYGTKTIPARPFIDPTFQTNKGFYSDALKTIVKDVALGRISAKQAMGRLAAKASADVKNTIKAGLTPPLAKSTVQKKGSTKPLVDTGQLLAAITWLVGKRG